MASLIVLTTFCGFATPTAANSMPPPIEQMACSVEITAGEELRFSLLPSRGRSSQIPLPVKPAGKKPSSLFHVYCPGDIAIPKHEIRRAEEAFDCAASKFVKLYADEHKTAGPAKPNPVRYTSAQRPAIAKAAPGAVVRKAAKVTAPVSPPVRGEYKRPRSSLPGKTTVKATPKPKVVAKAKVEPKPEPKPIVEAEPKPKPKVEVKPKSILKPARKGNVEYIRHCTEAPPDTNGGLLPATESIQNSTVSRFPTSEWDYKNLPIDLPDRYKPLAFKKQESGETLEGGEKPTKLKFHEHLVSDSWTARGRAVIRNYAVVRYRLKSKA